MAGPIRQNYFRRFVFHPAVEPAGINTPRPTVHDLRHRGAGLDLMDV